MIHLVQFPCLSRQTVFPALFMQQGAALFAGLSSLSGRHRGLKSLLLIIKMSGERNPGPEI